MFYRGNVTAMRPLPRPAWIDLPAVAVPTDGNEVFSRCEKTDVKCDLQRRDELANRRLSLRDGNRSALIVEYLNVVGTGLGTDRKNDRQFHHAARKFERRQRV